MRAAILEAIGRPLVVEDVELRAPGAHEVVVRITAIDVCITDALSARGDVAAAPPTILGHAAAGVVEEIGAHVVRVRPGDRVVVAGTPECGECFWCVRDRPDQCAEMLGGIFPPRVVATRADGTPVHADGGVGAFAERMVVRDIGVVAVDSDARSSSPMPISPYDCPTMSTAPTDAATTTAPERDLTPEELIARAIALRPELIEHQADAEARAFYSEAMHQKFLDAGFYRTYVPRRYGGHEFDVKTMTRLQLELARGDMSTAWCVGLASNHALQVGSWFGEEAQAEAFAGGNFRAASVAAPTVTATPVDGGWEINGTIGYCSGIPYSNWYMGQAIMPGETPTGEPRMMLFIAPESEWEMLNDWGDQLGLRGSGSHSIRFDKGRIASHLALEDTSMIDVDPSNGTPGLELHGNPLYCGRALCVFTMSVAGLVIGGAYNALDEYENWMRTKLTPLPPMIQRTEDPDFQRWYGLACAQIGTAEAAVMNCADRHMEYCRLQAAGERTYTWEDDLYLSTIAREAIIQAWQAVENHLYRTIGSSAAKSGQRFERVYRDLAMAAGHRNTMMRDPLVRQLAQLRLGVVPAGMQR